MPGAEEDQPFWVKYGEIKNLSTGSEARGACFGRQDTKDFDLRSMVKMKGPGS